MRLVTPVHPAARRKAIALSLQHLPAPWRQRLTWQDLATLPQWLASVPAPDLANLALWCGALWHGPALRHCHAGGALQTACELLGPDGLQAVRDHASLGRVRVMPVPARLGLVWRACGWDLLRADVAAALEDRVGALDLACCVVAHRADGGSGEGRPPPGPVQARAPAEASEVVACACDLLIRHGSHLGAQLSPSSGVQEVNT